MLRHIVKTLERLYPIALADSSWDNTGLLLEAARVRPRVKTTKVLMTIDLTQEVCNEAISDPDVVCIVAYRI